jgi:hypothetical protein
LSVFLNQSAIAFSLSSLTLAPMLFSLSFPKTHTHNNPNIPSNLLPLTGLKQISSPNKAQSGFVSYKYVPIVVQPLDKTERHRCAKRF